MLRRHVVNAAMVGLLVSSLATSEARAAQQNAQQEVQAAAGPSCTGDSITAIAIRVRPAVSVGLLDRIPRSASQAIRSWFATTRPSVVNAFLRLNVGEPCTEFNRLESERLLRAQPFIASAVVRAMPDGPGRVRLEVVVVDEVPAVINAGIRNGTLASATLGTQSFQGRGLAMTVSGARGFAYRNGIGAEIVKYGAFDSPYTLAAGGERNPVGSAWSFEFAAPFLTTLQRKAFRLGAQDTRGYVGVMRPEGPNVALKTRRSSYNVGWVTRVGTIDRYHTVGFVGAAILGEATRTDHVATIVSDSGLVVEPSEAFGAEYPSFAVVRLAAIGGLRSIRFMTVSGFDALLAQQDVGVGVQVHVLAGPSLWATRGQDEIFTAGELYAGVGHERSFASAHVVSEARGKYDSPAWDGIVSSARLSWYLRPSRVRTRVLSADGALVRHLDFPAQLTLRDHGGGVAGFSGARAAGGSRVVARLEERRLIEVFRSRGEFGVAAFANAGKLWAGDAPYGRTTPIRGSLGFSLLAAYPAGGKRTYRLDFAFPLNREAGGSRFELRVSAIDRTRLLWLEPRDVSRLRTGAVPAALMKW